MIKKEIRVLGISCGNPHSRSEGPLQVVGVVYRGNRWLEGAMRTTVKADFDPTQRIVKMIVSSPHFPQLRLIALDELVTKFGSCVNIESLSRKTGLPVVAAVQSKIPIKRPRGPGVRVSRSTLKTLANLQYSERRLARKRFLVYHAGLGDMDLDELLQVCGSKEGLPEAARVARTAALSLEKFLARHLR